MTKFQIEFREVYIIEAESKDALMATLTDGPDQAMLRDALVDSRWTEPDTVVDDR